MAGTRERERPTEVTEATQPIQQEPSVFVPPPRQSDTEILAQSISDVERDEERFPEVVTQVGEFLDETSTEEVQPQQPTREIRAEGERSTQEIEPEEPQEVITARARVPIAPNYDTQPRTFTQRAASAKIRKLIRQSVSPGRRAMRRVRTALQWMLPHTAIRAAAARAINAADARVGLEIHREVVDILPDFLGVYGRRYSENPPVIVPLSSSAMDELDAALGGSRSNGLYLLKSNIYVVRGERTYADRFKTSVHEQLHFASGTNGGYDVRFKNELGEEVHLGQKRDLQEGFTEYFAQKITRGEGHTPSYVAYPHETVLAGYLCHLVGEDEVRQAYLTGDFTAVVEEIDRLLIPGAAERILGADTGAEALSTLIAECRASGIDYSTWGANDPTLQAAEEELRSLEGSS